MKKQPSFPKTSGIHSKQAHTNIPEGTYEREFGSGGFFGPSSHIYHKNPPTGWSNFEGDIRPRAFNCLKLIQESTSPWSATEIMQNQHMRMRIWSTNNSMNHLVRNADGAELLFIHEGEGELMCDFGNMSFKEGDYIILPRSTMWRIQTTSKVTMLMVEATNESYCLPEKGMLGDHAIFDPAMLQTPQINEKFQLQYDDNYWKVLIKRNNNISKQTFPYNPLDALGWKGDNIPIKINWRDIRPIMSHRYHIPPSVHTTFVAPRFVVCTFVPRPIESDPDALKVPFYHSNNDFDEIIFYHMGEFFSRDNINPGMMTIHPAGFAHGPHPKAFKTGKKNSRKETDEVAVMIDTQDAVNINEELDNAEWQGYVDSWQGGDK